MLAGLSLPVRPSCHPASNSDTLSWPPAATPASSSTRMSIASWSCAGEVKPWWRRRSSPWNRSMSCPSLPARRTAGSTTATSHSASSAPSTPSGIRPGLSTTRHGSGSGRTIRQPRMSFDRASMSPAIAGAHGFRVNNAGHLEIGGVDALALARDFGTPLHVLDEERLRANCGEYRDTLAEAYGPNARAIFASKACCTIATCQIAHQEGLAIDVASGGELHTALRAVVTAPDLYFHGNNKTVDEVEYGLRAGVGRFVVDNEHEFDLLETVTARLDTTADILLRLTPGIEPHTHQAIRTGGGDSKFGFGMLDGAAYRAVVRASRMPRGRLGGLHAPIGSPGCGLVPLPQSAR